MSRFSSTPHSSASLNGPVAVLVAAVLTISCAPTIPVNTPVDKVRWLEQNWSDAERHWAHHASQGTATLPIPYQWFVSLEQPSLSFRDAGSFTDPSYLSRFGFIPSPTSLNDPMAERDGYGRGDRAPYTPKLDQYAEEYGGNPDGLPVGFARLRGIDPNKDPADPQAAVDRVGFTCAACHTGQLEYNRTSVRIDGAPAMTDLGKFRASLGIAIGYTELLPGRFDRFADRVLGADASEADRKELKEQLSGLIKKGKALAKLEKPKTDKNVVEGFTRLDALTRIGNQLFFKDMKDAGDPKIVEMAIDNNRSMVAPVNFPHIWSTSWFDWVQYDASIKQPMVRNAGEALGVSALINLTDPTRELFQSTVAVSEIFELEQLLAGPDPMKEPRGFKGLQAPKWPQDILGEIDSEQAARGAELYTELCAKCHLPAPSSEEFWADRRWTEMNDAGERYLRVNNIPISIIGTDDEQAKIMVERTVKIPAHLKVPAMPPKDKRKKRALCYDAETMKGAETEVLFAWALGVVTEKTATKWYDDNDVEPAVRERMNGYRQNCLRAELEYKARPLDGIWATAPFLHNGAVPNLYELLSPPGERSSKFYLGSRLFDPVAVGYNTDWLKGGFELDTSKPGNSNKGHEFSDRKDAAGKKPKDVLGRELSKIERSALVEYLKTL